MSRFAANSAPPRTLEAGESPVVEFLRKPKSYPDRPSAVDLIETHISWVFLTDRFVYKLKKPVRFEFLDFSDCERRRQACVNELRLNRRLAPDVYLDVVPITVDSRGRMQLESKPVPGERRARMFASDQRERTRSGQPPHGASGPASGLGRGD
jgi:aminoglycoside phosphotransferase family enzyme